MSTADKLRAEGKAEGKAEGRLEIVQRLLEARFGPIPETLRGRLRAASRETLDRWAVRILDAKSLEDVFAA